MNSSSYARIDAEMDRGRKWSILAMAPLICLCAFLFSTAAQAQEVERVAAYKVGRADAPIVLEFFWAPTCLYSAIAYRLMILPYIVHYVETGRGRLVVYNMNTSLDKVNTFGAATFCVGKTDYAFAVDLFLNSQSMTTGSKLITLEEFKELLEESGVSADRQCLAHPPIIAFAAINARANALSIEYSPSTFLNGHYIPHLLNFWQLEEAIEELPNVQEKVGGDFGEYSGNARLSNDGPR